MVGSHITCWFLLVVINDYIYIVIPIAGRLLTDSLFSIVIVVSSYQVLIVVDFDCSVLPIAGRPA